MSWSQNYQSLTPAQKLLPIPKVQNATLDYTVNKQDTRNALHEKYNQFKTPIGGMTQPKRAIIFYGDHKSKHLFPLYKD